MALVTLETVIPDQAIAGQSSRSGREWFLAASAIPGWIFFFGLDRRNCLMEDLQNRKVIAALRFVVFLQPLDRRKKFLVRVFLETVEILIGYSDFKTSHSQDVC